MKIADRYISIEFLKGFLLSLVGLLVIYIVVDLFEHISKFVDNDVTILVVFQYYLYEIPWIIGTTLSPIACLLGCFISLGNLSKHFELDALRFSGMSTYRMSVPLLCMGLLLSAAVFGINEVVAPVANQKKSSLDREKIKKRPKRCVAPGKNIYYSGENNKFYQIKFIDPRKGDIKGLTIYEFRSDYSLKQRLDAPRAMWRDSTWTLFNGSIKTFKPRSFEEISFGSLVLDIKETPLDFVKEVKHPLAMGFSEFKRYINKRQRSGDDVTKYLVDLNTRVAFPFMNLIVILLGFPLASKVRNIGFIIGFTIALFVSFLYWGLMQLGRALGHTGALSPVVAGALPNLVLLVIAGMLIWKFRK
jgi:lipopolysaccharide export system permease protein